ncbi:MAG: murein biosynthesis integral membrane protein MurJ [Bryobacteraceae bacterium]
MEPGIARSAGAVSAAVALSRLTGLAREMVMARLFGAGAVYDAYLLGFRIPNLTRDLFAEGALSSAFVPSFSRCLAGKGRREANELGQRLGTVLLLAVTVICALGMLFSPQLVSVLAPGFARVPGKFELAVELTRIMFPFLVLVALAAQAMGMLNAAGRFGVPALASAVFNVSAVTLGLALGLGMSPIHAMSWGVVLGGMAQLLWQAPSLMRCGFTFRPRFDWRDAELRSVLRLMGPAVLGSAAVQINIVVNTNFASSITDAAGRVIDGPVSWLGYAFRFMQLPIGIFGVAIASATLPVISRSAALARTEEFRSTLASSLGMTLLLTIPSSAGLAVLGQSMIAAVYQSGKFQSFDTQQTALALAGYAAGLSGYALVKVLAPALYALGDARTPMLVSIGSIAVNLAAASLMVKLAGFGHVGLALSTSVNALFAACALYLALSARLGGVAGRALVSSAWKITAASAVMGCACWAARRALIGWSGDSRWAHLGVVAVCVPAGALLFAACARALRIRELAAARDALRMRRAKLF